MALEPGLELLPRILREGTVMIDSKDSVHHGLDRAEPQSEIHHRCHGCRQTTHDVCVRENIISEFRLLRAVFKTCRLNYVADLDVRRAGHLTSLAVQAQVECLVIEERILQTVSFAVRTGLLRARIIRVDCHHRAIYRADSALHALLESGFCGCMLIFAHFSNDF